MATPVGPAPVDPDDPDLWDWDAVDEPAARQGGARRVVATVVVLAMLLVIVGSLIASL